MRTRNQIDLEFANRIRDIQRQKQGIQLDQEKQNAAILQGMDMNTQKLLSELKGLQSGNENTNEILQELRNLKNMKTEEIPSYQDVLTEDDQKLFDELSKEIPRIKQNSLQFSNDGTNLLIGDKIVKIKNGFLTRGNASIKLSETYMNIIRNPTPENVSSLNKNDKQALFDFYDKLGSQGIKQTKFYNTLKTGEGIPIPRHLVLEAAKLAAKK